jgi:hypothetical protein
VIEAVREDALRCSEGALEELRGPWEEGGVLHLYRHGTSTRPVEVAYENGEVSVRVLALSSPDDFDLAFRLTEVLGGDGEITHEEHGAMPAREARSRLGNEWMVRETAAAYQAVLEALRDNPENVAEVMGPVRRASIGRKMLERVGTSPTALLEVLRRLQFMEDTHRACLRLPFTNAGKGTVCTPWSMEVDGFYGAPTHLGLLVGDDYRFITVEVAREAAADAWIPLDEHQFAIDAIPEGRRAAIRKLVETKGVGPKTWWQFWR